MDVLVPIRKELQTGEALGVLVLAIDPETYLYPFLQSWPEPSHTAETLLVRREAEEVVFLNPLRFKPDSALKLRFSLAAYPDMPAVKAVLETVGIVESRDYRHVPVMAAVRRISASAWFLVARMDLGEIFGPLRERLWVMVVLVSALLLGTATGVGMIWRQQRARFYRERYAAAEQLRVLSERQEAILSAIPDILMEVNRDQVYTWANAPGLAFFGEDVIGRPAASYYEAPAQGNDAWPSSADQSATYAENWQRRRDGEKRLLAWWCRTLFDDGGQIVGTLASARDITERRRAEAELQQKNDELVRFTYTVSHDLKSPLVTIRTFLGYVQEDLRNQDAAAVDKDLDHIGTAAEKMSRLLDELLTLSRIGRMVNPSVMVPLQAIVEEAMDLVAGQISARGVAVQVTQQPVLLFGDRARLVELFQNLLDNAVKFMGDQASPCVQIGVQADGGEAVLFVQDNGIGIDPRHQSKLFGLFEKLDPASDGTGIGLALVRRIVEVHRGRIWVESEGAGKGTKFCFTLARTELPTT